MISGCYCSKRNFYSGANYSAIMFISIAGDQRLIATCRDGPYWSFDIMWAGPQRFTPVGEISPYAASTSVAETSANDLLYFGTLSTKRLIDVKLRCVDELACSVIIGAIVASTIPIAPVSRGVPCSPPAQIVWIGSSIAVPIPPLRNFVIWGGD